MATRDLSAQLKKNAEAVQAVVEETRGLKNAFSYAIDLARRQGGRSLAAAGFTPDQMETLADLCGEAGMPLLKPPLRDQDDHVHTAVTPVSWGIAETGTLVLQSADEDLRLATMLADTHVACLRAAQIKPDLASIQAELDLILKSKPATYVAFITGPSRTADIERVLAIGVHGPRELHILLWKDR